MNLFTFVFWPTSPRREPIPDSGFAVLSFSFLIMNTEKTCPYHIVTVQRSYFLLLSSFENSCSGETMLRKNTTALHN